LNRREKFQEAVPFLRAAAEKMPESFMAHYELGLTLGKLNQWEAALPQVQTTVERMPTSAQMHFDLAVVYTHLKNLPDAIEEYEKTLQIDPDNFQANLIYGRLVLLEGHPETALPKLSHAATLEPESEEAHNFLAVAYQRLGQAENAERERAKAIQLRNKPPQ